MSNNLFVTFGTMAGTEQLQTRTRTGVNSTTCSFEFYSSSERSSCTTTNPSCSVGTYKDICSGPFYRDACTFTSSTSTVTSCNPTSNPGCYQGASYITCSSVYYDEVCKWNINTSQVSSCTSTNPVSCSDGAFIRFCDGPYYNTICEWYMTDEFFSIPESCPNINPECTSGAIKQEYSANGQFCFRYVGTTYSQEYYNQAIYLGYIESVPQYTKTTYTANVYNETYYIRTRYVGTNITVCNWTTWTNWTDTDVCSSATPACTNGALQRECRIV
jgi:hypothetical protein